MSPRAPDPDERLTITLPEGGTVAVRAFPHDGRFVRDIRRAVLAVQSTAISDAELFDLLQGALRGWYPHVDIRPRDGLAGLTGDDRVWYVMRDGTVGRNPAGGVRERSDRLYAAMSDARAATAEADAAIVHAHEAIALAGRPRPRHGGARRPCATMTRARRHDGRHEARRLGQRHGPRLPGLRR